MSSDLFLLLLLAFDWLRVRQSVRSSGCSPLSAPGRVGSDGPAIRSNPVNVGIFEDCGSLLSRFRRRFTKGGPELLLEDFIVDVTYYCQSGNIAYLA